MSKLDQLRRQREEQHARQQEQVAAPKPSTRAKPAPMAETVAAAAAPAAPLAARKPSAAADALEGKCSVCGKARPLANGLVSNHQKGFGKMCPGSRKEPA